MWKFLILATLAFPALAHADDCRYQAPRNATLDLTGVRTLVVDVHHHRVHLTGTSAANGQIHGRACASNEKLLPALQLTQHREGDRLIIEANDDNGPLHGLVIFGDRYHYLDLQIDAPAGLAVEMDIGSGDGWVDSVDRLKAAVGSGDLDVRGVRGHFEAQVSSGDIKANNVGDAHVGAIGSGDFKIDQVRGSVAVGSVGSGDFTADRVQGDVTISSVGSGDATAHAVGGNVDVGSIGSGELRVKGVGRNLHVASLGSGDIEHDGVTGKVNIPKRD